MIEPLNRLQLQLWVGCTPLNGRVLVTRGCTRHNKSSTQMKLTDEDVAAHC